MKLLIAIICLATFQILTQSVKTKKPCKSMAARYKASSTGLDNDNDDDSPTPHPFSTELNQKNNNYHPYNGFGTPPPIPGTGINSGSKRSNLIKKNRTSSDKHSYQNNSIKYNRKRNFEQNHYSFHNQFQIDNKNKETMYANTPFDYIHPAPVSVINFNEQRNIKINDDRINEEYDVDECKYCVHDDNNILQSQNVVDNVYNNGDQVEQHGVGAEPNHGKNKEVDNNGNYSLQNEGSFKLSATYRNLQQDIERMKLEKEILLLELKKKEIMLRLEKLTTTINVEMEKVNTDIKITKIKLDYLNHK